MRTDEVFEEPATEIQQMLAAIWEEVLGVQRIGAQDDFFQLGGHSILATRVVSRIRRDLGVALPLRRLFTAPTLAQLAEEVEELAAAAALTSAVDGVGSYEEELVL